MKTMPSAHRTIGCKELQGNDFTAKQPDVLTVAAGDVPPDVQRLSPASPRNTESARADVDHAAKFALAKIKFALAKIKEAISHVRGQLICRC
jgi:hypothetical protein